jgi:predicted enzyme related to lactoylglutathione lyase
MKALMPGMPSNGMAYVSVDDIKAATEKAKSLGATVIRDITPVSGMGSFSIISDPTGAVLGLWKADRQ